MSLRKKLYYPCRFVTATGGSLNSQLFPGGGALSTILGAFGAIIRFVAGTGLNNSVGSPSQFFGADPDRYGGVTDPNLLGTGAAPFNGVASPPAFSADQSGKRRASQEISAKFQCSSASASYLATSPAICVDFVAPTTLPLNFGNIGTLPSVDPATVRRPWLRIKGLQAAFPPGATLDGMLYIDRQHSVEV